MATKLSTEKRDRDQDFDQVNVDRLQQSLIVFCCQVNSRITELVADLATRERTRESSQREQVKYLIPFNQPDDINTILQEAKAREQSQLGNAEKQKIIMQISAVQTDLVRMMDER